MALSEGSSAFKESARKENPPLTTGIVEATEPASRWIRGSAPAVACETVGGHLTGRLAVLDSEERRSDELEASRLSVRLDATGIPARVHGSTPGPPFERGELDSLPVSRLGSLGREVLRCLEVGRLDKHEPRVAVRSSSGDRAWRGKVGDRVAALGDERQVRLGTGLARETVSEEVAVVALGVCSRLVHARQFGTFARHGWELTGVTERRSVGESESVRGRRVEPRGGLVGRGDRDGRHRADLVNRVGLAIPTPRRRFREGQGQRAVSVGADRPRPSRLTGPALPTRG